MRENAPEGRFNKYSAAAYKTRAMLHAASIANFSDIEFTDDRNGGALVCGIPGSRAAGYYQTAYEAALLVEEGGYTLYLDNWQEGNPEAQYTIYTITCLTRSRSM